MRLLVTGGTGFLGQALVREALAAGHDTTVLTRRAARGANLPPAAQVVEGTLSDAVRLGDLLESSRADALVHAAAIVSDSHPDLEAVNVGATAALARAAADHPRSPRVVFVSSFAVEDVPATAYSGSKRRAEAALRESGAAWVILRPTLIYGPGDHQAMPRLVARMARGSHWLPRGGRARIQPVFVDDVAAACVQAATRPGLEGRTYRLGGPEPVSVRGFREAVRDASGGQGRVRSVPLWAFAPAARLLAWLGRSGARSVLAFHRAHHDVDSSLARHELGFAPCGLAAGLTLTFPR